MNTVLIIPLLTKSTVTAAKTIDEKGISRGITLIAYLIAVRCQNTLIWKNKYEIKEIQQAPSMRFNAKQIANSKTINFFLSMIVVAETVIYQAEKLSYMTKEEIDEFCLTEAQEVAATKMIPGCRVLKSSAINENNLLKHRLALKTRLIGTLQSRPIFDPKTIIKGISIEKFNFDNFIQTIIEVHQNLDIIPDEELFKITQPKEQRKALFDFILQEAYSELEFDDALDLGTHQNLSPLEKDFEIKRSTPNLTTLETFTEEQKLHPMIKYADKKRNELSRNKNKK